MQQTVRVAAAQAESAWRRASCAEAAQLSARQQRELARMAGNGEYSIAELAEVFTISRATVYRTLQRSQPDQAR